MDDTSRCIADLAVARHEALGAVERMRAAAAMREAALRLVAASLPSDLHPVARRLAIARRFYGHELPDAMLQAYATCARPAASAELK